MRDLVLGMAGSGGDGVVSAGEVLLSALAREGYAALLGKSFGSQIRGGESSCRLRVSADAVLNSGGALNIAVALNWDDFQRFAGDLTVDEHTVVIYDSHSGIAPADIPLEDVDLDLVVAVPIAELAQKSAGRPQSKNLVVLGLLCEWLRLPQAAVEEAADRRFSKKDETARVANRQALAAGRAFGRLHPLPRELALEPLPEKRPARPVVDGNEMCARGALYAGCRFFGGYPITPASEIMQYLQREIWKYGGTFLQAEDEIAGIGAAVGASFAGTKAMTATSGPGFSLKAEMLGLASAAEIPLVCIDVQRGGPSTGMPAKQEQADLFAAAFSAHGDSVRPILAPVDAADAFALTVQAFAISETYQTPVIVLSDQEIAQSKTAIGTIDAAALPVVNRVEPTEAELEKYTRFRLTPDGVSPISRPGMRGGNYLAAGLEHDEHGAPSSNGGIHARMNDKRLRKFDPLKDRRDLFLLEGDPAASIGLIAWGTVAGVAREALALARAEGIAVRLLVPKLLYPVSEPVFRDFFGPLRRCVVVEQSHQGQLFRILRMWTTPPHEFTSVSKSGGTRIAPSEMLKLIRAMAEPAADRFREHYCDLLNIL